CHAGARRTRLRARELVLRSAWDLLLREATGRDVHHALPTMVRSVFDLPLAEFLGRMAENERVDLPAFDPAALERAAVERVHEIRVLELPRLLFRRALELWVDLDRAASLDELGWTTALGTFCDAAASPRNLAIHASRPNRIGSGALHSFTSVHEQDRPPPAMLRT
ncbi:MAG TPA: hypothetical protein PKA64_25530, partial [Myxococcota bacterium]|nr:hypothetical protein [Myxococcota bacterium]